MCNMSSSTPKVDMMTVDIDEIVKCIPKIISKRRKANETTPGSSRLGSLTKKPKSPETFLKKFVMT